VNPIDIELDDAGVIEPGLQLFVAFLVSRILAQRSTV